MFKLGESENIEPGIATDRVVAGFFSFLGFPRLLSEDAVRRAIARGVETGLFGYATGRPALGDDGRYQLDRSRVAFERSVADDEVDLDSGFLMVPTALPLKQIEPVRPVGDGEQPPGPGEQSEGSTGVRETAATYPAAVSGNEPSHEIFLCFTADRDSLFGAWNALANRADLAGKVSISATATAEGELDRGKFENGVLEPLRELGLIDEGSRRVGTHPAVVGSHLVPMSATAASRRQN